MLMFLTFSYRYIILKVMVEKKHSVCLLSFTMRTFIWHPTVVNVFIVSQAYSNNVHPDQTAIKSDINKTYLYVFQFSKNIAQMQGIFINFFLYFSTNSYVAGSKENPR